MRIVAVEPTGQSPAVAATAVDPAIPFVTPPGPPPLDLAPLTGPAGDQAARRRRRPLLVAIGTNDLLIPWNARVYVLPLLALTVLTWSAGLGDGRWTLAAVVVVGGFIAQAHAGTSLLVGLCTIWALTGLRHRRDRGAVLGFAALAGALMWAPALLDAARHGGGNLSTLAGFSLGGDGTRAGYALAWDRLADTLSPRAFWLLGQHPTIELDGTLSPRGGGAWGLLLLAAGTVIAHRRRATRVVALGLLNMSIGFFIVSRIDAQAAYWGPILVSMLLMANGLSLVTSPSTEAVMGSLPLEKAGVGSAVNDLSREVGGTLGVAVAGSIFVSLYSPRLGELFTGIPGLVDALPEGVLEQAQDSVGAAYAVAQRAPDAARPTVLHAVSDAFMHGFSTACVVTSLVALAGSAVALRFLPARATPSPD